jgi:hypothetical protein
MLTNTVGIVLFILIFTVLTAGGVLVAKRFPVEQPTNRKPLFYFCSGGRVLPLDEQELSERCRRTGDGRLETQEFIVRASGLSTSFTPRSGKGESVGQLREPDSAFRRALKRYSAEEYFLSFLVHPDGLEAFRAARELARGEFGFSTGWNPLGADEPVTFGPGGRRPGVQP